MVLDRPDCACCAVGYQDYVKSNQNGSPGKSISRGLGLEMTGGKIL